MCYGPEEPPPGRFGFKKHAGLIRVNVYYDKHSTEQSTLTYISGSYNAMFV